MLSDVSITALQSDEVQRWEGHSDGQWGSPDVLAKGVIKHGLLENRQFMNHIWMMFLNWSSVDFQNYPARTHSWTKPCSWDGNSRVSDSIHSTLVRCSSTQNWFLLDVKQHLLQKAAHLMRTSKWYPMLPKKSIDLMSDSVESFIFVDSQVIFFVTWTNKPSWTPFWLCLQSRIFHPVLAIACEVLNTFFHYQLRFPSQLSGNNVLTISSALCW